MALPSSGTSGLFTENEQRFIVVLNEPYYGDTPVKTTFFTVKSETATPYPLILGIGAAIAGSFWLFLY